MNGQVDINEYYSLLSLSDNISKEEQEKDIKKANNIRNEILNEHPEFSMGQDGEFYRLEIDPEEKVEPAVKNNGLGFNEYPYDFCYKSELKDTYGEYIEVAKEFEDHCKYIYSLIVQAYKDLGEQVVTLPESKEKHEQDSENGYQINEFGEIIRPSKDENIDNAGSVEITAYKEQEDEEVSELDGITDEELDNFIEKKKMEKEQKIKRVKELIALNKELDEKISELESLIKKKGRELDD